MKFRLFLAMLLLFASCAASAFQAPVSKMQNAVSGVTQQKMQANGFTSSDPRYSSTLTNMGSSIGGIAASAAVVAAAGATAPAWVTLFAAGVVGLAVTVAIQDGLNWYFKDGGKVQVGDNPQSVNTPAGAAPPQTIYCMGSVCGVSPSAACLGQKPPSGTLGSLTWTGSFVFVDGHCNLKRSYSNGDSSVAFWGNYEIFSSNKSVCPGVSLSASNGVCPASNFPELPGAPVKSIPDAANDLTAEQKAKALDLQIVADLANQFWKTAAAAPGYDGLPYDATRPITSADAATWQAANPTYWPNVGDFVAPQAAPSGGTSATPFTMPTSTTPVSSADPTTQPSTGTNPSTQPIQNLGPDPGIGAPSLEAIPTAQQILSPLLNLFPSLKNFVVPGMDASCPHWSFVVFNRQITISDHCSLLESIRPTLYAAMAVAYALLALLIVLAA